MTDESTPEPRQEPSTEQPPGQQPAEAGRPDTGTAATPTEEFWASVGTPTGGDPASTATNPFPGEGASTRPPAACVTKRDRPLFGTIFWGVVLLAFAAFMVVWTLQPGSPDPTLWLLGSVIVVGVLLVVAGIAAATRRAD